MGKYNSSTGAREIYRGIIAILILMPCKCICRVKAFFLCSFVYLGNRLTLNNKMATPTLERNAGSSHLGFQPTEALL